MALQQHRQAKNGKDYRHRLWHTLPHPAESSQLFAVGFVCPKQTFDPNNNVWVCNKFHPDRLDSSEAELIYGWQESQDSSDEGSNSD
jgi:hypothetical protein